MRGTATKRVSWGFMIAGLLLIFLFGISGTSALAQISSGTILGTVLDPSHAAIPGATVTLLNTQTGLTRTATTDAHGTYRFPAVPTGNYTVKIEKAGFRTLTLPNLTLTVAQSLVANGTLQVGATQQQVVVTGAAAVVNTTTSTLGGLVNDASIAQLPLNGRNYTTLALLQPGVEQQMTGSGAGQAGVWYSSNGAGIRSNYATLDGAPIINLLGGSVSSQLGTSLGVDGIKEFRVITTGFGAQYGLAMGSQMVLVSKGGTNRFHGDAYDYLRNSHMDARNYFDTAGNSGGHRLPEFQRNDFGGSIGGPIRKNKTFFYGVFEGVRQNLGVSVAAVTFPSACFSEMTAAKSYTVDSSCVSTLSSGQTITVPSVMRPLFALYPSPNGSNNLFSFGSNATAREYYGQMRVDQSFSASDTFFARYTIDNATGNTPNGFNGINAAAFPGWRALSTSRYQFLTLSENHIYSPTLLGVTHLSFARTVFDVGNLMSQNLVGSEYSFIPGQPMGGISVTGLTSLGPAITIGPPDARGVQNIYTLSEDLYDTIGNHALQFGALINRFNDGLANPFFTLGSVTFPSIQSFMEGLPANYSGLIPGSPGSTTNYWYNTFGFYLQDDWKAFPRLTLNLGLRYEFRTSPTESAGKLWAIRNIYTDATTTQGADFRNASLHNFSPRLGFAWDVTGKGTTAIRGGFGLYYDLANLGNPFQQSRVVIPPLTPQGLVVNPTSFSLPFVFTAANIGHYLFTDDYNLGQPYGEQYSLTVEQQLPGKIALAVAYVGFHGSSLYQTREGNPVIPTSITGFAPHAIEYWNPAIVKGCANIVPSCRVNPNFTQMELLTTRGYSWYNSLQVTATKQIGRGLEFNGAYTWSRSLDNTQSAQYSSDCSNGGTTDGKDPIFGQYDYGPSCFDLTQNFNLDLMYHFPNIQSHNFAAKILHGWWIGNIITVHTGFPFSPLLAINRSCMDGCGAGFPVGGARPSVGTGAGTLTVTGSNNTTTTYNFIPYNKNSVTIGKPTQWFNPLMFMLPPPGYIGTASRMMLRAPGLSEWDFSVVKDTALPFLGEAGNLEFRAEFFNILNHTNLGFPNSTVFTGALTDVGAYSEAPNPSAGQITSTATTSRQVQLALKILF
ncbi:MAG TPA: carboxypeptidase regulatory-like domain-containing protein [Patescibacteria group bacterium]|nr:carboxypeptidase regulatory-like domain-containing protein [Patescibacteria group bacterium]